MFLHEVTLVKDHCRLDIRKNLFSQRTINEWNKLSTDCVTASGVKMFKNRVDTYLRRAGYKFLVHLPSGPLPWMAILLKCGLLSGAQLGSIVASLEHCFSISV